MPLRWAGPPLVDGLPRGKFDRRKRPTVLARPLMGYSAPFTLRGFTVDAVGQPLLGAIITVYGTDDDAVVARGVSDAVTGAYSFQLGGGPFYIRIYKVQGTGLPDIFGTSVNTLFAAG